MKEKKIGIFRLPEHIEISQNHKKLRWILAGVFFVVGAVALGFGLHAVFSVGQGWQTVSPSTAEMHCGASFVFQYDVGAGDEPAAAEFRNLTNVYSQAVADAYAVFESVDAEEGNLAYLNAHPNETVTVDKGLYEALRLFDEYNSRALYLAPVYAEYARVFACDNEVAAAKQDPAQNPEVQAYIDLVMSYVKDAEQIDLQLLPDNQVNLQVSEEYLDFAKKNGIENLLDFGWMKNAFIADFLAERLISVGYTNGIITSVDGFTRNLDKRKTDYSLNLADRYGDTIYQPGVLQYTGGRSFVFLRNYPLSGSDRDNFFTFESGRIVSDRLNPETGKDEAATDNMLSWSENLSCGEILLQVYPLYTTENLSQDALNELAQQKLYALWFEDLQLHCTDASANIQLHKDLDVAYEKAQ